LKSAVQRIVRSAIYALALLHPAHAQVDFGHVYSHMPSTLGLLSTPAIVQDPGGQARARSSRPRFELGAFNFRPTVEISAAVERETVQAIAGQRPNSSPDELLRQFQQARLKPQFDALLRKYGYSPDNLADVIVAYAVLSWEAFSQGVVTRAQIDGATAMLREALAQTPRLAALPDAEKQRTAEKLAYAALLGVGAMRSSPDPQFSREQVRNHVRQTLGIDFARVRLTHRGFILK
jgi:hypothetical protein